MLAQLPRTLVALLALSVVTVGTAEEIMYAEAESVGDSQGDVDVEERIFLGMLDAFATQSFDDFDVEGEAGDVLELTFDGIDAKASLSSTEEVDSLLRMVDAEDDSVSSIVYLFQGQAVIDFEKPVEAFAIRGYLLGWLQSEHTNVVLKANDGSMTTYMMTHSQYMLNRLGKTPAEFFVGFNGFEVPITRVEISNAASIGTGISTVTVGVEAGAECSHGVVSKNGRFCCSKSCGTCGGCDCADKAGGALECCPSHILETGVPCIASTDTGCILHGFDTVDGGNSEPSESNDGGNSEASESNDGDRYLTELLGSMIDFDSFTEKLRDELGASVDNDGESDCP